MNYNAENEVFESIEEKKESTIGEDIQNVLGRKLKEGESLLPGCHPINPDFLRYEFLMEFPPMIGRKGGLLVLGQLRHNHKGRWSPKFSYVGYTPGKLILLAFVFLLESLPAMLVQAKVYLARRRYRKQRSCRFRY